MNKFNNPRLTNTTVSGTGVKHPMRPHVILGDPENGFIRGDLLDANAVIKLIKNAAKAIGALEELEQSNWIDDDGTTEEPAEETVGVLADGELGFIVHDGEKVVAFKNNLGVKPVGISDGGSYYLLEISSPKAFGLRLSEGVSRGYVRNGASIPAGVSFGPYDTYANNVLKNATPEE